MADVNGKGRIDKIRMMDSLAAKERREHKDVEKRSAFRFFAIFAFFCG
jgi:hypothetical protein